MGWIERLKLGTRFTLIVIGCVCAVVGVVATYLLVRHDSELRSANQEKSRMLREEMGKRGLAIVRHVAHASERALAMRDYLFLAEIIDTAKVDDQLVYAMLMNHEGRALVHSDQRLAGQILDDEAARFAVTQKAAALREREHEGNPILEVVAPIIVADKPWGVARFAWSLDRLNQEIDAREREIRKQLTLGVLTSIIVTILLVAVAIAVAVAASGAVVRPLLRLRRGVNRIYEGQLEHRVEEAGSPELVDLAAAFNAMTLAVRHREMSLASALDQAQEANRLKSEFIANVSHELRTPLNAIVNVPGCLLEDYKTALLWVCKACEGRFEPDRDGAVADDKAKEECPKCGGSLSLRNETFFVGDAEEHKHLNQRALQSGEYLLRVVTDLLDVSRLQAGRMELHLDTARVAEVIDELHSTVESLAEAKGVMLTLADADSDLMLRTDRVKLLQVLVNLVGNAIKFTDPGGRVDVLVEDNHSGDASMLTFGVRDTGIGIPEGQLDTIFDTFSQVDGSHTRNHGGTGLGLSITRQLVELLGGRVWAESTLGGGSTFRFTAPKDSKPIAGPMASVGRKGAWGKNLSAVVVDDDEIYGQVVSKMMTNVGMQVELVSEPRNAVRVVKKLQPDFVLLDMMMPRLSGIGVLRMLKRETSTGQIPVLISTAFHGNREVVTEHGALWLAKPWRLPDLMDCLLENGVLGQDPRMPTQKPAKTNT